MAIVLRIRIFKDAVSASTHFAGFLAAIVGVIFLLTRNVDDPVRMTAMAIYGASLMLVFLASSVYHFFDLGEGGNRWLKRVDHSAIFFMIAGTYIPVFVVTLEGAWLVSMLSVVGGLTVVGLLFKLAWLGAPRWLVTSIYLLMGWLFLIPAPIVWPRLSSSAATWLLVGGLIYTVGALVYAFKWPDPWPRRIGFHEIWHVFVLAGAGAHYMLVLSLAEHPGAHF